MSKSPLLLAHLIGVAISVGSVLILDLRLATLLLGRRINSFDVKLIELLTPLVRIGLALLWLSGLGFLLYMRSTIRISSPIRSSTPRS